MHTYFSSCQRNEVLHGLWDNFSKQSNYNSANIFVSNLHIKEHLNIFVKGTKVIQTWAQRTTKLFKEKVVRNYFWVVYINSALLLLRVLFQTNPFRATKIRLCRKLFENWWLHVLILTALNGSVGLLYLKSEDSVQEDFCQTRKSLKLNGKDEIWK